MLWVVEQRKLWGDLGSILISGMASRESSGGPLLLERTGPFLPPISMPWYGPEGNLFVVSDELRRKLEFAKFPGLSFGPVTAKRVVRLDWHQWNLSADEPAKYPQGGEPESYIDDQPHDQKAAALLPQAWELLGPISSFRLEKMESPTGGYLDRLRAEPEASGHPSLFISRPTYGYLVVDSVGRECLSRHAGQWIRFLEIEPAT